MQTTGCQIQTAPDRIVPEFPIHVILGLPQRAVARPGTGDERNRRTVLDHPACFEHQHACEVIGVAHVVGDAEQRRPLPQAPRPGEQLPASRPLQTLERLVEDHQPGLGPKHSTTEPHPLPFAARDEAATLAEVGLQPLGQALEHTVELGVFQDPGKRWRLAVAGTIGEIGEQ